MDKKSRLTTISISGALFLLVGGFILLGLYYTAHYAEREAARYAEREFILCADGQGAIDPERTDVIELSNTVCGFLDDWYVHRDRDAFWSYVSANSPMQGIEEMYSGAFTGEPEQAKPDTLDLGIGPAKGNWESEQAKDILVLLNSGNERFAILQIDREGLLAQEGYTPGDPDYEKMLKMFPTEPYYPVVYHVNGEGYTWEGIVAYWVLQDDEWKFRSFSAFD